MQNPEIDQNESQKIVPRYQWRLALLFLGAVFIFGLLIILATLLGIGNPPRASILYSEYEGDDFYTYFSVDEYLILVEDEPQVASFLYFQSADSGMFRMFPPLTIEMAATNEGADESAWGLHVTTQTPTSESLFLIRDDGYFSVSGQPGWRNFLHIRPDHNELYLHINQIGNVTFRINSEIAWTGRLTPRQRYWPGIASIGDHEVDPEYFRLYVGQHTH